MSMAESSSKFDHSPSRPESSHTNATSVTGRTGGHGIFPGMRPGVDYKRLAEQHPLKCIDIDKLAPSL